MKKDFLSKNFFLLLIIVIIFYVGILIASDISQIIKLLSEIKIIYLPIIFTLVISQLLILGIKYHRMLKILGIETPLQDNIKIFVAGISLISTPGGTGTAIKSQILKKKFNIPLLKSLPTIFMERLTELIGNLLIIVIFFYWTNIIESTYAIVFSSIFIFFMLLLISKNQTFKILKTFLTKINRIKKFSNSIEDSKESFEILTKKNNLSEMILWSILAKILQLIAVYCIFLSLNIDLGILLSGQIYFTSLILGSISFLPSGIIVTESTMIAILNNYGIELSLATSVVILIRLLTTWFSTIFGIVIFRNIQKSS